MKFCPECGISLTQPPALYCSQCGSQLGSVKTNIQVEKGLSREDLIALVGEGWNLLEAGDQDEAAKCFQKAGVLGWPGGWLSLSHIHQSQARFAEASEFAERAFREADGLTQLEDRLSVKAGAALGAAQCLVGWASNIAEQELDRLSPNSEVGAGSSIMQRVPSYVDYLLTTDGLDAETAVLGAEFGASFFMTFGHDGSAGSHYGRMLDCLGFVLYWGNPQQ